MGQNGLHLPFFYNAEDTTKSAAGKFFGQEIKKNANP